jgi:hypothetical protein
MNPIARRNDLREESVEDEVVVFDIRTSKAHCLHPLTARIRELSDGTRSVSDITAKLKEAGHPISEDDVWAALDGLADADLLERRVTPPAADRQVSRRRLVRTLAAASAIGAFGISSIVVPLAAQTQSGGGPGEEAKEEDDKESSGKEQDRKEENHKEDLSKEHTKQ